jgi:DNA modification methylase
MTITIHHGDSREVLKAMPDACFDAVVTDPPYGLEFMGKEWDAPWQVSSKSALFGDRKTKMPGFNTTRNPTCVRCGGRLRGAKKCSCESPAWDEAPNATRLRQMQGFQDWCQEWAEEVYRVLKPGGHLIAFGGTRTYHRLACAIEDGGFEVRDMLAWMFGSGFPKSHNVAKGIDKAAGRPIEIVPSGAPVKRMIPGADQNKVGWEKNNGREYQPGQYVPSEEAAPWEGWGTALKPAHEPICLARKPLAEGTVAGNVLAHGTGALNIDACRVPTGDALGGGGNTTPVSDGWDRPYRHDPEAIARHALITEQKIAKAESLGRWPANVATDGSEEVIAAFPETQSGTGAVKQATAQGHRANAFGAESRPAGTPMISHGDSGSAARFFYSAKADAGDRLQSKHPTVKPVDLMRWLVRLVTPKGGHVLDPFAGSGTTGMACMAEGFDCTLIEREAEYVADIRRRVAHVDGADTPLFSAKP